VRNIVSWIILVVLAVSFVVLAQTAGSSGVAIAVAALGFFFVLGLWFLYREFSLHGSLSRSISVGEPDEVWQTIGTTPPRRIGLRGSMPMALYQAMAFDQEGKFQQAIDVLQAHPLVGAAQRWATLSMCIKAGVYAHLDPPSGRRLHTQLGSSSQIRPRSSEAVLAQLADGRLLVAEKNYDQAITVLLPLSREIQLGPAPRAIAHYCLMQSYQETGDAENMQKHRREAGKLAGKLWFANDVKTA
jgi:hypothetical protein